ncbi:hypothetical protein IC620_09700 [Hazenella sp. IB182357]|uniref:Uncharacterized protein n=1 Tax=Polycladospora coralii TaxID=2771432 RepID=A0A926NAQ6_9BACL|nr:hypothetical protein [Polycladospora coralii]MBD1372627.1 hypothetical protein [Polycladospora coralii]MBS7531265.1 hypothetical protein [Polycladospora coralii]
MAYYNSVRAFLIEHMIVEFEKICIEIKLDPNRDNQDMDDFELNRKILIELRKRLQDYDQEEMIREGMRWYHDEVGK